MEKNGTIEIVQQFQLTFARVFEDQIQQLIQESRKEALAQAKTILRENALNNVLEAVVGGAVEKKTASDGLPSDVVQPENTLPEVTASYHPVAELSVQPARIRKKPNQAANSKSKDAGNAPPVLNDRILEEIEAIREQIRRNELLLSQIKPFVQTSKVQEE